MSAATQRRFARIAVTQIRMDGCLGKVYNEKKKVEK